MLLFLSVRSVIRSGITMSLMSSFPWWRYMWTAWPTTPIWWRTTGRSTRLRSTYSSQSEHAGKVSGWSRETRVKWCGMDCIVHIGILSTVDLLRVNVPGNEVSVWFRQNAEIDKRSLSGIWTNCSSKVKWSMQSMYIRFILTATVLLCTILSNGSNF